MIRRIGPAEAKAILDARPDAWLLDVRTVAEWNRARIPGARLAAHDGVVDELLALDRATPVLVVCHHGGRSLAAASRLAAAGFTDVANVEGGIDRWSREVDPAIPRY